MLELKEHQFEILPSVDATEGVGFGIGLDISLDAEGFKPGSTSWSTQDQDTPRGSTAFGRDVLTGPSWGWDLFTNRADTVGAVESLGKLATAWRAQKIRDTPGAVLPIRYRLAGRDRRIYGRPRDFDAPPNNLILSGFVPITTSFKCADAFTYDDAETVVNLSPTLANTGGGFTFPLLFPASTLPPSTEERLGAVRVGGDEPAAPIIRFQGPVSSPWMLVDGEWRVDLDITLSAGEYAVVDTRSWMSSALKNGSQNIGGKLGRRQWLPDMRLAPGEHELSFGGNGVGAGATCTVAWRNTWNSI